MHEATLAAASQGIVRLQGAALAAAATLLPPGLTARLEQLGGKQERLAVALQGEAGLALAVRRPMTAAFKLVVLWVADEVRSRVADAETQLLDALEQAAAEEGAAVLKVEVAAEGPEALDLYLGRGYRRMELPAHLDPTGTPQGASKHLDGRPWPHLRHRLPYFGQTTGFTCGPACLSMALAALGDSQPPSQSRELELWREATLIFAPSGPGGCDPFGLALAAARRGYAAQVLLSRPGPILLGRANSEDKRELMRFVQADFREKAAAAGVDIREQPFILDALAAAVGGGQIAILLIDESLMHVDGAPHWILLHDHRDGLFLAHDPWMDQHLGESWVDAQDLLLPAEHLERMAWYGEPPYRAAVLLSARRSG